VPMPKSRGESAVGGHCLSGNTKIPLLDGSTMTMKELAETKEQKWVYSIDKQGNVVPGKVNKVWKTGEKECIKIILDNDKYLICTPDHKIMLRNGKYKKAGKLKAGDSLMPLYRKKSKKKSMEGYELVYNPESRQYVYSHRVFCPTRYHPTKTVVHHQDFDKSNNEPTNLKRMTWNAHTKLHAKYTKLLIAYAKSKKGRAKSKELMEALWADKEWSTIMKEKLVNRLKTVKMRKIAKKNLDAYHQSIKDGTRIVTQNQIEAAKLNIQNAQNVETYQKRGNTVKERMKTDLTFARKKRNIARSNLYLHNSRLRTGEVRLTDKQIQARRRNAQKLNEHNRIYRNHKVKKIIKKGIYSVYDMEVDKYHNFALGAGIFVHNCMAVIGYGQKKGYFKVRNSWGVDWGDKGNCYFPEAYINSNVLGSDYWVVSVFGH
jgi:hypothetical protein